jgi:ubiquinone biosynthesis protein
MTEPEQSRLKHLGEAAMYALRRIGNESRRLLPRTVRRQARFIWKFLPTLPDVWLDLERATLVVRVAFRYRLSPRMFRVADGREAGERLRLALEELGLTYLKFGQFLAMRLDIVPEDVQRELNRLFEDIAAMEFVEARRIVETELGASLEELYSDFSERPIAAASVAQVHEARTRAGDRVAVKIQRSGIRQIFESDMRILQRLAIVVDRMGLAGQLSVARIVGDFQAWTLREFDFGREARTAERIRLRATRELIPRVYWDLTSSKVITMEFIEGVSLARIIELVAQHRSGEVSKLLPNLDTAKVGDDLGYATLHQLFISGIYHGDPHPGNILVRRDNRVAYVDFGIAGELTPYQLRVLQAHIENIVIGNIDEGFRYFAMQYTPTEETDVVAFYREGRELMREWYQTATSPGAGGKERLLAGFSDKMFGLMRKHNVRSTMDTLLFWRALAALDFSANSLSHYFDMMGQMRKFFEILNQEKLSPVTAALEDRNRQWATRSLLDDGLHRIEQVDRSARGLGGPSGVRVLMDEEDSEDGSIWLSVGLAALSATLTLQYFRFTRGALLWLWAVAALLATLASRPKRSKGKR